MIKLLGAKFGSEGRLTSQRPQSDHVIEGPMKGLKKNVWEGDKIDTYIRTDIATSRPNRNF